MLGQTDRICVADKVQHMLSRVEDPHAVEGWWDVYLKLLHCHQRMQRDATATQSSSPGWDEDGNSDLHVARQRSQAAEGDAALEVSPRRAHALPACKPTCWGDEGGPAGAGGPCDEWDRQQQ